MTLKIWQDFTNDEKSVLLKHLRFLITVQGQSTVFSNSSATMHLMGARGIDNLVSPIQVDTDDSADV